MARDVDPPVRATPDGYLVALVEEERELLIRLMGELRDLLVQDDHPYLERLFPTAYPDDDEAEAEYQRLMRDELVTSRTNSINSVTDILKRPLDQPLTEGELLLLLQSLNAVRVVLGTILGITDDDDAERIDAADGSEQQLYGYLSWLLEWTVQALSRS